MLNGIKTKSNIFGLKAKANKVEAKINVVWFVYMPLFWLFSENKR